MCLTQESRPDRWKQAKDEFNRVGLRVDKWLAMNGPDVSSFDSFNLSQYCMVQDIANSGEPGLIFEDDVVFKDTDPLMEALIDLPINWDMLYLGANLFDPCAGPGRPGTAVIPLAGMSRYILRINAAWTTHAYGMTSKMASYITQNFKPGKDGMIDDWLAREVHAKFNCFIVNPMVCWQRPGFSDLWGNATDYEQCFEAGNRKMREALQ